MLNATIFYTQNLSAESYRADVQSKTAAVEKKALAQALESDNTKYAQGIAAISSRVGNTRAFMQAIRNITNSNTMILASQNVLSEVKVKLTEMRALALEAKDTAMTSKDRLYLNAGFEQLKLDIQNLSTSTLWRGNPLLDGSLGSLNLQVGSQSSNFLEIKFADLNTDFGINEGSQAGETEDLAGDLDIFTNLSVANASLPAGDEGIDLNSLVITGVDQSTTLGYLDTAIARLDSHRKGLDVIQNSLTQRVDLLENSAQISKIASYKLIDQNEASEVAQFTREQILQRAGSAQLAQANQSPQSVAALLIPSKTD
jgi:flagellin